VETPSQGRVLALGLSCWFPRQQGTLYQTALESSNTQPQSRAIHPTPMTTSTGVRLRLLRSQLRPWWQNMVQHFFMGCRSTTSAAATPRQR